MKQSPVLNDSQVKKVFKSVEMTKYPSRNRLILTLSYYVGLRSISISSLTVGDVLHGDGSVNTGHSTVVWRVGKACDGKRYDYQLYVHGPTGFVEKKKFNISKKVWVDF